jgi:plastocyanin
MNMPRHSSGLLALVAAVSACASPGAGAATVTGRVLAPDGAGIAQAVVFVNAPIAQRAKPGTAAEMNQVGKTFVPHVLPVVAGTSVNFPNSDQIQHHVYSFSRTKTFELPLYRGEAAPPVLFDKPGVVKLGCNIHDWMSAVILVVPTPWFAVTDEQGRFTLRGLPPGDHALVAWHERSRKKAEEATRSIALSGADAVVDFELALAAERARPAVHGSRSDP